VTSFQAFDFITVIWLRGLSGPPRGYGASRWGSWGKAPGGGRDFPRGKRALGALPAIEMGGARADGRS
jgi:hypothetical protein